MTAYFYRYRMLGSDSRFNPINSSVHYGLDAVQVRRSFDEDDLELRSRRVWSHLVHPFDAAKEKNGYKGFVNRQIVPVDPKRWSESGAMVPNYALHLLGGGMMYRKNAEWFDAKGYTYPRTYAAVLSMVAEVFQEVTEKKSTVAEDEVADVWLFRPAGILLFNQDGIAQFAAEGLGLLEWPHQAVYLAGAGRFGNVGQNFVARPGLVVGDNFKPFLFFGLTTLAGVSHSLPNGDAVSWGLGAAVVDAMHTSVELRPSAGFFWDRNDSLLASILFNATEGLATRVNIYPGVLTRKTWSPGVYLGLEDGGGIQIGAVLRWSPIGWGVSGAR